MKKIKEVKKLNIGDVDDQEAVGLLSQLYYEIINKPVKKDYVYDVSINIPNCSHGKALFIIDDLRYVCTAYESPEGNDKEVVKLLDKMRRKIIKELNKKGRTYDININIHKCNYEKTFYIVSNLNYPCTVYKNSKKGGTQ